VIDEVEFVVDLTPPPDDDEAANLVADISLTKGIKNWYLSAQFTPDRLLSTGPFVVGPYTRPSASKSVPDAVVFGHDDSCRCAGNNSDQGWISKPAAGIYQVAQCPAFRNIIDYCGVRHRSNIVRLLLFLRSAGATQPSPLLINSAARMWTLVQVAFHLDLAHTIVSLSAVKGPLRDTMRVR
jgi:hypothetical protein